MRTPRWVRQEDPQGCSIAVLAMLTGLPYAQVKAEVGFDGTLASACAARHYAWLAARGLTATIAYLDVAGYDRRAEFIPEDRPHLLWLSVGENGWRHSVLQLPDGSILDPEHPEPRRLEELATLRQVTVITEQA
jgi:hypothetical protein